MTRLGQSKRLICYECSIKDAPKCPQCGQPRGAEFEFCARCQATCKLCGWKLRDGRCVNKHTTTKPYQTAAWRKRRAEVIARTSSCEWCSIPFDPPKRPAVVHHVVERPQLDEGSPDWDRYGAMRDDEVAVICKGCHKLWTDHRVRHDDPRIRCPCCGGFKAPRFETCWRCKDREDELSYKSFVAQEGGPPLTPEEEAELAQLYSRTRGDQAG